MQARWLPSDPSEVNASNIVSYFYHPREIPRAWLKEKNGVMKLAASCGVE